MPSKTDQPDRVLLVRRGLRLGGPDWNALVAPLPPAERRRIAGLRRWEDRQDSAIGWRLLHRLADEHAVTVRRAANGRPQAERPLDMSLAHGGGWISVAASVTGRVGVDVETVRDVPPSLARRCLSADERVWTEGAQESLRAERFFRLWTAKEAYVKATGEGLAVDPRDVRIDGTGEEPRLLGSQGRRWRFSSSTPVPGVCLTVCVEIPT
jgi:4'-phosphopantetheinyl transferase